MSDIVLVQDRDRIDEAFVNITHAHTPVAAIIFMSSLPLRITISHSETHQSAGSWASSGPRKHWKPFFYLVPMLHKGVKIYNNLLSQQVTPSSPHASKSQAKVSPEPVSLADKSKVHNCIKIELMNEAKTNVKMMCII